MKTTFFSYGTYDQSGRAWMDGSFQFLKCVDISYRSRMASFSSLSATLKIGMGNPKLSATTYVDLPASLEHHLRTDRDIDAL